MWELFGQVWILCAIAFLAGAAVTWLVFVLPRRHSEPARPVEPAGSPAAGTEPGAPESRDEAERTETPASGDPAISGLDAKARAATGTGTAAADALDRLGARRTRRPAEDEPAEGGRAQ
jgi:hypothetical protein